jgi:ATP-dependent protease ClpP protease subunit
MATADGNSAEITMYGEIVESQPIDWWTGEPVEGQFIVCDEFLADLERVAGCGEITIRMNSIGGDAGVSILIHNRLRELAAGGTSLTCIVDGVAMSGGSLIMCACDKVQVNPSSIVMIHKCAVALWGAYNSDELKQTATTCDAWDKAQVSIYKRKCGLTDTVISHMMAATTYMTGAEAVEKGFADEVLKDAEPLDIAASEDGRSLIVRGKALRLVPGMFAPDSIPTVKPGESPVKAKTKEDGGITMANTLDELRAENPNLAEQLMAQARQEVSASAAEPAPQASGEPEPDPVQAERLRMQQIDEVAVLYNDALVREAKYDKPCTAQELTYRAAQEAVKQGQNFLAGMNSDAQASGAQNVTAMPEDDPEVTPADMTPEQAMANARAGVKALLGKKEEK